MTNSIYLKRLIRGTVCVTLICVVFYLYLPAQTSRIKKMNTSVGLEHVDVLCIGSSHMGYGLNPIQMYSDYGYATYVLWCGSQSPWQSYYYLKEALKYQKPSLVIVDVYKLGTTDDNAYEDSQTVNNLLNTPLSINKIKAVMESKADSKLDIILRYPYIHDEYSSFSGFSLNKFIGNNDYSSMGYIYVDGVDTEEQRNYGRTDMRSVKGEMALSPKNEKYLREIIEFCLKENTSIILINAPWPMIDEETQQRFNSIGEIASEYNISFIDGNLLWDELGMDWTQDSWGDGGHLNHSGITKFTTYVENYINNNYYIPDRRNDINYKEYDEAVEWLAESKKTDN